MNFVLKNKFFGMFIATTFLWFFLRPVQVFAITNSGISYKVSNATIDLTETKHYNNTSRLGTQDARSYEEMPNFIKSMNVSAFDELQTLRSSKTNLLKKRIDDFEPLADENLAAFEISKHFKPKELQQGSFTTKAEDHPYVVLLKPLSSPEWKKFSLGTLISEHWVLTTAQCLSKEYVTAENPMVILAGADSFLEIIDYDLSKGAQLRTSSDVHRYSDQFKEVDETNDIGLLRTHLPFTRTKQVHWIQFDFRPWGLHEMLWCESTTFDQNHRKTHTLLMASPCLCGIAKGRERDDLVACNHPDKDPGLCQADFGAALVCDGKIRGVLTILKSAFIMSMWGKCEVYANPPTPESCGPKDSISVFTQTKPCFTWIHSTFAGTKVPVAQKAKAANFKVNFCMFLGLFTLVFALNVF